MPAGRLERVLRLRLHRHGELADPLADVDEIVAPRRAEADEFYDAHPSAADATDDERRIQRQALAGLLWTKQSYLFDVASWLDGDNPDCAAAGVAPARSATSTGGTSTRCA